MEKRMPVAAVQKDPIRIRSVAGVVVSELFIPGLFLHALFA